MVCGFVLYQPILPYPWWYLALLSSSLPPLGGESLGRQWFPLTTGQLHVFFCRVVGDLKPHATYCNAFRFASDTGTTKYMCIYAIRNDIYIKIWDVITLHALTFTAVDLNRHWSEGTDGLLHLYKSMDVITYSFPDLRLYMLLKRVEEVEESYRHGTRNRLPCDQCGFQMSEWIIQFNGFSRSADFM